MQVYTIDLRFLGHTEAIAAYVVETDAGPVLIESGPFSTMAALEEGLRILGWSASQLQALLLTHIHLDHAGAAWYVANQGVRVYVHPIGAPHLEQPERLMRSAQQIYGDQMDRLWGAMQPIAPDRLHATPHGERLVVGGHTFTAWHTPGHATHHIAWQVDGPDGDAVLFTGDAAGVRIHGGPPTPPCPPPDIHVEDWLASIDWMRRLPVSTLYLTHFGGVSDLAAHWSALETQLKAMVAWMRPFAEQQTPIPDIVPQFQSFYEALLLQAGTPREDLARYEAANPAFMSVAGLMRYWKKAGV